jgi:hypothetical protein
VIASNDRDLLGKQAIAPDLYDTARCAYVCAHANGGAIADGQASYD